MNDRFCYTVGEVRWLQSEDGKEVRLQQLWYASFSQDGKRLDYPDLAWKDVPHIKDKLEPK